MDFQTTIRKMHEVRHMDFSHWTGEMVGRHLFAAGKARINGENYMFPGYMKFPIRKYDNTNPRHLPFELNMHAGPNLLIMEHGNSEWNAMRNHWKAFVPQLIQRGKDQMSRMHLIRLVNRPANGARPNGEGGSAQTSNVNDQLVPGSSHPIQLPDDDEMPMAIPQESVRDQEIQANTELTTAQPSNALGQQHDPNLPSIVADVEAVHLSPNVVSENVPNVEVDDEAALTRSNDHHGDVGFGYENLSAIRRAVMDEFGYRPVPNQEQLQNQVDNLDNDDHSQEPRILINRPILQARRRNHVLTVGPNLRAEELPAEELRVLMEEASRAQVPVDPMQPIATSTPVRDRNTAHNVGANANAVATDQLSIILENVDIDPVVPQIDYADVNDVPNIQVNVADGSTSMVGPTGCGAASIPTTVHENQIQPIQQDSLDEHGLPRRRAAYDADRANHAINKAVSKLGRNRQPNRNPRPVVVPIIQIPRVPEHEVTLHPRLGNRPDYSAFYDRIYELISIYRDDAVPIDIYLQHYITVLERMQALNALADVASEGVISIERNGANGPIIRFRREM